MPVIRSAKKKLRKDIKREEKNDSLRISLKESLKKFKKTPTEKNFNASVKLVDKASKNHIIHKNKAARIKSKMTKLLPKKTITKDKSLSPKSSKKSTK